MTRFTTSRLALSLALTAALSGCATMPMGNMLSGLTGQGQEGHPKPDAETKQGAKKGAAMGCLIGAGVGLAQGGLGNAAKGCIVGGAAGALVGGARAYRQQLTEAKAIEAEAKALGIEATVSTITVEARSSLGQPEQVDALDALTLNLDPKQVAAKDERVARLLEKAAKLADSSELPTTLSVRGPQRAWMLSEVRSHLAADSTVQVQDAWAAKPALVVSPVPVVPAAAS